MSEAKIPRNTVVKSRRAYSFCSGSITASTASATSDLRAPYVE